MFLFYVIITNTMAYWYDGAALAATNSPVIALFWCLIKFTTTTTTTNNNICNKYFNDYMCVMLYIMPTYLMLFAALSNGACCIMLSIHFFCLYFFFAIDFCKCFLFS